VARTRSNAWIVAIGVFKLVKAALLVALAVGALELEHHEIIGAIRDVALTFHVDPHGRLVTWLVGKAASLSPHKLTIVSLATGFYAALFVVEGIGLVLRKRWGEIATIGITGSFIPWEVYEAIEAASLVKLGLLGLNVAIIVYLTVRVRQNS
jgi:uncharacterized membrane protein (DUF2068 family)